MGGNGLGRTTWEVLYHREFRNNPHEVNFWLRNIYYVKVMLRITAVVVPLMAIFVPLIAISVPLIATFRRLVAKLSYLPSLLRKKFRENRYFVVFVIIIVIVNNIIIIFI